MFFKITSSRVHFISIFIILSIFLVACSNKDSDCNIAPMAIDDNATLSSENNFTIDIFKNDYDVDGNININSIQITEMPKFGDINLINGKIKYFPKKILCGKDSFKYKVADNLGKYSNIADVNVSFCIKKGGGHRGGGHKGGGNHKGGGGKGGNHNKNTPPISQSDSLATKENTKLNIVLKAKDKDGDKLKYIIVKIPQHGKLSGKAPNLIYIPDKNYIGEDSFTFKVNDGKVDSNIATITIKITDINLPPIADAGKDYIGIKGNMVKFDGSKSRDLDGNITKYIWKEGNITLSTKVKFEMKFMKIGVHKITLTVIDDKNATDSDEKIVTIKPCCKGCVYPDPTATKPFK